MSHTALFEGLIADPDGRPVTVVHVGGSAQYVVDDGGFKFHHDAETIDRLVLAQIGQVASENRDALTRGVLQMIGQDDLFTKAAVDAQLNNMQSGFDQLIRQGLPENARTYLGMLGFRIVLNFHGEIERIDQPTAPDPGDGSE
ncbi:MAG TPA: hypothetical protein PK954_06845 [Anaerolineales bacterium]|nr:hypothetical protein [Anaerolineales bacterium]HRF46396.1 hypothetical protein [Anaerolineales bacterium]